MYNYGQIFNYYHYATLNKKYTVYTKIRQHSCKLFFSTLLDSLPVCNLCVSCTELLSLDSTPQLHGGE